MNPRSLLLCVLVLLSFFSTATCSPLCNNDCCRFVEGFPVRLKKLRQDYTEIRGYYVSKETLNLLSKQLDSYCSIIWIESDVISVLRCCCTSACLSASQHTEHELFLLQEANDDLDTALLDQSVEDSFKSEFACHAMNSILGFYLGTILPTALAGVTDETRNLKPHMESIQNIFDELKSDVTRCRHYFSCKTHFDIKALNSTYTQMASKGLYKAMGELDLLFNYIESYLASKRQINHVASG
uniref:interleukin-10 isoform X1 n=1 Tax=Semicossyphus pulcher TaxID=241346 RepID=UPI0037E88A4A